MKRIKPTTATFVGTTIAVVLLILASCDNDDSGLQLLVNNPDQLPEADTSAINFEIINTSIVIDTSIGYSYPVTNLSGSFQMVSNTDGSIVDLYEFQDQLYAAGYFTSMDGVSAYGIATYNGTTWLPIGSGLERDIKTATRGGSISDMIGYQGSLYVTGWFTYPGGVRSSAISRWDGNNWQAVPGVSVNLLDGFNINHGNTLEVFQGELYIGGSFTGRELGPRHEYSLVKWDGSQLKGVALPLTEIHDLEIYQNHLYVSGGEPSGDFVVAFLDGSGWNMVGIPQEVGFSYANSNLTSGLDKLFISFQRFGESSGSSAFISWDGIQLQGYGDPFSLVAGNYINDLIVINNVLYIAGGFWHEVLATSTNGFLTFDGQQWGAVPGDNKNTSVRSITKFQNQLFMAKGGGIVVWQP